MGIVAVLGLGHSINLYNPDDYEISIGVNDIWKFHKTTAIVCLDYPKVFTPDRLKVINESTPDKFYSQIVIWDTRKDFQKINIIPGYPDKICNINTPDYQKSYCSPFVACQIAFKIYKATEIHLYGVDMLNHPNLKKDICVIIKKHFNNLNVALLEKGCKLTVFGNGILTA